MKTILTNCASYINMQIYSKTGWDLFLRFALDVTGMKGDR